MQILLQILLTKFNTFLKYQIKKSWEGAKRLPTKSRSSCEEIQFED